MVGLEKCVSSCLISYELRGVSVMMYRLGNSGEGSARVDRCTTICTFPGATVIPYTARVREREREIEMSYSVFGSSGQRL